MAETYTGEVRNGVVVFDEGTHPPPEGTKVRIRPANVESSERVNHESSEPANHQAALKELSRALLDLAGTAKGLPADYAENHDHYLHGQPKR